MKLLTLARAHQDVVRLYLNFHESFEIHVFVKLLIGLHPQGLLSISFPSISLFLGLEKSALVPLSTLDVFKCCVLSCRHSTSHHKGALQVAPILLVVTSTCTRVKYYYFNPFTGTTSLVASYPVGTALTFTIQLTANAEITKASFEATVFAVIWPLETYFTSG